MLYDLKSQGVAVHPLLFDYKQRHSAELQFAKYHAKALGLQFTVLELPQLGGMTEQSWVVPNRNAIFLSVAVNVAHQAGADAVTIGCNLDDSKMFPDCRPEFISALNQVVRVAGYQVEICAPYIQKRKWEIGAIARDMGITSGQVWTCYRGGAKPCGNCPACEKLSKAFA